MILIDMSQATWATISMLKKMVNENEIDGLVKHSILNVIRYARTKFSNEFGEVVVCFDHKSWRKDVFPHYKATRKKIRDKDKETTDKVFSALREIKNDLKAIFPYYVLHVYGAEGDDVISVLSRYYDEKHVIYSSDKDLWQLTNTKTKQFNPIKKEYVDYGVSTREFLFEHIIRGDAGDGIPNIRSPETAFVNCIRQTPITKGFMKEAKQAWLDDKLEEFFEKEGVLERWQMNKKLIDLGEIPEHVIKGILDEYEKERQRISNGKMWGMNIMNYFVQNKMKQHMEHLHEFVSGIKPKTEGGLF